MLSGDDAEKDLAIAQSFRFQPVPFRDGGSPIAVFQEPGLGHENGCALDAAHAQVGQHLVRTLERVGDRVGPDTSFRRDGEKVGRILSR